VRLQDKVAVVTGSASGIGREIALRFAREGARLLIVDRNEEGAARTRDEIRAAGGSAERVRADIAVPQDVAAMEQALRSAYGRADVLVNSAGVGFHRAFVETTLEDFERVLRINLVGTFLVSQAVVRLMIPQGSGKIIHIASIQGQRGGSGRSAYGASKAGVIQLAKVMAVELGHLGIAVNAIAPGPIQTPMTNHGPDQRRVFLERTPMHRLGNAAEVAAAAVFLASDECSYTTGHTLNVDGGIDSSGIAYSYEELTTVRSGPKA
jgi:NAD(P)-dependent dehydrogenase (short-subunit alcohol dehydrogenase family)